MGLTKPRAAQIYNLDYKQATRVVTVTNITLAGGAPSSVDGVSLTTGDRVLVTAQTTGSQNGIYKVTTVGSGANGTWARTTDADQTGEIEAGMIIMVTEGAIYADTQWKLITDDPITIGTTTLTFTQNYSANSISSGSSNVTVNANANVTISSAGTANVLTVSSTGTVTTGTASATGNITGGNIRTAGQVSATANITGGNLVVPGNGYLDITGPAAQVYTARVRGGTGGAQFGIATSNTASFGIANDSLNAAGTDYANLTYSANTLVLKTGNVNTLSNRLVIDSTGIVSVVGNITSGNILTGGLISATGNITGNYFLGNVFYANGITASKIYNGTSEANVGTSGGNANISIGGTSNVVVFASTGEYVTGLLSVTGNITGGNIAATAANISTFIGNTFFGSVPAQPTYYNIAPLNLNNSLAAATKVQLNLINTGGGAGAGSAIDFYTYQISVAAANAESRIAAIDDGNYSAYLSLQTKTPGSTGTNGLVERVKVDSTGVSVVANITGGNILTGGLISATGNITGGNISATTHTGTTVNVTANITGGNLLTGGLISATSNITGANINTAGNVSATGNIAGNYLLANIYYATGFSASRIFNGTSEANIGTSGGNANISIGGTSNVVVFATTGEYVTGVVSATGNITGSNLVATTAITNGNITITGANIVSTGPTLYIDPNGAGGTDGNVIITGNLSVQGNVTYINSNNVTTNDLTINVANNASSASQADGGGIGVGPAGSEYISLTYNSTSNIWVASNGLTSQGILSATGNVTGGNILTGGLISATGNITGNYHIGNGSQLTGISAFGNVTVTGGNSVVANSILSTLTLTAGSGITLVATPGTGVITISTSSGGNSIFATGGDMGTVTETVTASEDLGLVTDVPATTSYDLGSVVSASGLIYPSQLILPSYIPGTLPSASPAAQFVYLTTSSIGAMTAFSDGTNWRFTSSGNVVS